MSGREIAILAGALVSSVAIMGSIVWSQRPDPTPIQNTADPDPGSLATATPATTPIDENEAARLRSEAEAAPDDAMPRVALGDLYFEAGRFDEAIPWYEEALARDPASVEAGTNLGVSYYYVGDTDRAVAQFEQSLETDPTNQRVLLSLGIVRAFGLQDLDGAEELWARVIEIAPDTAEGRAARDALDRVQAAHQSLGPSTETR